MERFTSDELTRLVAYEQLYGPIGPRRFDVLFARLGMDVVAPHLKKGKRTKIDDHIVTWGEGKPKQTPEEMLAIAKRMQRQFERRATQRNNRSTAMHKGGGDSGAAGHATRATGRGRRRSRSGSTANRGRPQPS